MRSGTNVPLHVLHNTNLHTKQRVIGLLVLLVLVLACGLPSLVAPDTILVSAGGSHSAALTKDGTVLTWGYNSDGQLGNGTHDEFSTVYLQPHPAPLKVKGLSQITNVSAGGRHTLALTNEGTVWGWGRNVYGQLGNRQHGEKAISVVPITIVGLSDVAAISAGCEHSLALKHDGTVWAWGSNKDNQLGHADLHMLSSEPLQVDRLTNIVAISAGCYHSLALDDNGTVWAWGSNEDGQLGDGTTESRPVPIPIPNLKGTISISAGVDHSLALANNGAVWAWGSNDYGQLGNSLLSGQSVPLLAEIQDDVVLIAAGSGYSLALSKEGTVWSWGDNSSGELGIDDSRKYVDIPSPVPALTDVKGIAAGGNFSLAAKNDGTVWAWGTNDAGEVGVGQWIDGSLGPWSGEYGHTVFSPVPVCQFSGPMPCLAVQLKVFLFG